MHSLFTIKEIQFYTLTFAGTFFLAPFLSILLQKSATSMAKAVQKKDLYTEKVSYGLSAWRKICLIYLSTQQLLFFFFQNAKSCIKPLLSTKEIYSFLTGNTHDEELKDWLHSYVNNL